MLCRNPKKKPRFGRAFFYDEDLSRTSVELYAKDATEEGIAVVLLLDAAIVNMTHISRYFVFSFLAEGKPDARVLVELKCGRKLTFDIEPDFGQATDPHAQFGKNGRRSDIRSHPEQGWRYACFPE